MLPLSFLNGVQHDDFLSSTLRDKAGVLMQKGSKIMTTHKRLAELMDLPCRCAGSFKHGKCDGASASLSELYTKEFAQRAAKGIMQEMDFTTLIQECRQSRSLPPQFGMGAFCTCGDVSLPQRPQYCSLCVLEEDSQNPEESEVEPETQESGFPIHQQERLEIENF